MPGKKDDKRNSRDMSVKLSKKKKRAPPPPVGQPPGAKKAENKENTKARGP